jgi:hypothetical protein
VGTGINVWLGSKIRIGLNVGVNVLVGLGVNVSIAMPIGSNVVARRLWLVGRTNGPVTVFIPINQNSFQSLQVKRRGTRAPAIAAAMRVRKIREFLVFTLLPSCLRCFGQLRDVLRRDTPNLIYYHSPFYINSVMYIMSQTHLEYYIRMLALWEST